MHTGKCVGGVSGGKCAGSGAVSGASAGDLQSSCVSDAPDRASLAVMLLLRIARNFVIAGMGVVCSCCMWPGA